MEINTQNATAKKSNIFILTAAIFIGFLVFGFSENIKGPAIPRIQADFSLIPIIPVAFGKYPREGKHDSNTISLRDIVRNSTAWLIVFILSFGVIAVKYRAAKLGIFICIL